jgi:hypothetical protein
MSAGRGPCGGTRRGGSNDRTADREVPSTTWHYRGRLVVDLRPRAAGGKREALEGLLAELRPAALICFGDDSSDADAFAVLRSARDAGELDGLAVGVTGPHGIPDEVRAGADVILETPFEAARLLASIARAFRRETPARGETALTR